MNKKLSEHSLYKEVWSAQGIRVFMQYHVFCVWDFQSLAKKIQQICSPPEFPWMPHKSPELRRLINEVILEEETDTDPTTNSYCSHYELYLKAMEQCGADISLHNNYMLNLQKGENLFSLNEYLPGPLREFLDFSFELIFKGKDHELCAVFAKGRESLIPDMFSSLVSELDGECPDDWSLFHYYLQRHIEVDGGDHGPASEKLYKYFCDTPQKEMEAQVAVAKALQLRDKLWSYILKEITKKN
ncbi:DUF3050 domain-containing protein [Lentisphaera marina]|uniref:DUF3050 domain-containing protein n=1 Tax=Lentisphaera marina TaxID=1111041 RepID=UPI00236554C7|nr:DUF3050 domain-containing protein [Lentisphaera marina]MDD7985818.1 DUF3050 domain-containing protein [Lentisphaera marina]